MSLPLFCDLLLAVAEDLAAPAWAEVAVDVVAVADAAVAAAGRFFAVALGFLPLLNSTCGPTSKPSSTSTPSPPPPFFFGILKFFVGTWATLLLTALVGGGDGLLLLLPLLLLRPARLSSLSRLFLSRPSRGCFALGEVSRLPVLFLEPLPEPDAGLRGDSLNLPLYSSRMLGAGGGVADFEEGGAAGAASLGSDLRPGLLGAGEEDLGGTEDDFGWAAAILLLLIDGSDTGGALVTIRSVFGSRRGSRLLGSALLGGTATSLLTWNLEQAFWRGASATGTLLTYDWVKET